MSITAGDAFYVVDRRSFVPTLLTQGPWDPGAQHGGPVAGLLATVVDATPSRIPLQIVRLTVDLLRPVPLEPLDVERQVVREGRRIQAVEVLLLCGTDLVARCSALRVRIGDDVAAAAPAAQLRIAGPEHAVDHQSSAAYRPAIRQAVDVRVVPAVRPGEAEVLWIDVKVPVLAGHPTGAVPRLAVAADFTSLAGARGAMRTCVPINGDLNLHILRPPQGQWIGLRGRTAFSDHGTGISVADVFDLDGLVGSTSCAQVVERRDT